MARRAPAWATSTHRMWPARVSPCRILKAPRPPDGRGGAGPQPKTACSPTSTTDPLTSREREILQRIAEGQTTKEIAARLGLSVKTVESHRINLMRKLDIHETATLVRYAIRRGLTTP